MKKLSGWTHFVGILQDDGTHEIPLGELENRDYKIFYENYRLTPVVYLENAPSLTVLKIAENLGPVQFYRKFADEIDFIENLPFISSKVEEIVNLYHHIRIQREPAPSKPIRMSIVNQKEDLECPIDLTFTEFFDFAEGILRSEELSLFDKFVFINFLRSVDNPEIKKRKYHLIYPDRSGKEIDLRHQKVSAKLRRFLIAVSSHLSVDKNITLSSAFLTDLETLYSEDYCSIGGLRTKVVAQALEFYFSCRKIEELIDYVGTSRYRSEAMEFISSYDCQSTDQSWVKAVREILTDLNINNYN